MKKIFFETLKHKLGHYLLVIFCGILMVSTKFWHSGRNVHFY